MSSSQNAHSSQFIGAPLSGPENKAEGLQVTHQDHPSGSHGNLSSHERRDLLVPTVTEEPRQSGSTDSRRSVGRDGSDQNATESNLGGSSNSDKRSSNSKRTSRIVGKIKGAFSTIVGEKKSLEKRQKEKKK